MEMMKNGNINGYFNKLIEVNDVRLNSFRSKQRTKTKRFGLII